MRFRSGRMPGMQKFPDDRSVWLRFVFLTLFLSGVLAAPASAQQGIPLTIAEAEDRALDQEPGKSVWEARADALEEQAGINDYEAMCVQCHGAPGRGPTTLAQGLNPQAPDLAASARSLSAAELFWVTKHGIKMTGMPAWGASHDDASLWPVVAFLTRLPELDAAGYRAYLTAAAGQGHHEHDGKPGSHDDERHSREAGHHGSDDVDGMDNADNRKADYGENRAGPDAADASHADHDGHDHEH